MKILITGGHGFLGQNLLSTLNKSLYDVYTFRSKEYDLLNYDQTTKLFEQINPDIVIHLAAVVGGIGANQSFPGSFFYKNMLMGLNVIEHCRLWNIKKIIQVGTVCSYPKFTSVPFKEEDLWLGYPEETNAPYGIAKKSLFVMLDAYKQEFGLNNIMLLPSNLYGPYDNFDTNSSHVIPALIKKFVWAKINNEKNVKCWGTGNATREFLYVSDASEAIVQCINSDIQSGPINIGGGYEISIKDLADKVACLVGFDGNIVWDTSKPDGQPRRYLDISKAKRLLEWEPKTDLDTGLKATIEWYAKHEGLDL
jgi:GDP-L-fucose synthase